MNLPTFLAHAIQLEQEAEAVYRQSAAIIDRSENGAAIAFFHEMAGYSRLHLEEVKKRAAPLAADGAPDAGYVWDQDSSPEALSPRPRDGDILDLQTAMAITLAAERRAAAFYADIADSSTEPSVRALAREFAEEESQHVLALERFMGERPY